MRWHIHPINQARSEQGLPTINSIWLSGISHQHDVHLAHELKIAQKIISDQAWMPRVAQNHSLVCMSDPISRWEDLAENTLIYHRQAKQMWPAICQMLQDHDLVLEVIDFPKSVRKRRFTSDNFRAHPLAFWRKSKVPTWEELNA
jgi:2,3-bisphosphoglycerate-independent phosphoglycerate mutase